MTKFLSKGNFVEYDNGEGVDEYDNSDGVVGEGVDECGVDLFPNLPFTVPTKFPSPILVELWSVRLFMLLY